MNEIEFLSSILREILNNPESIKITKTDDMFWTLLEIEVAKEDLAILIWTKGRTIESIRTIMRAFSAKNGKRVNVKIIENN